MKKWYKTSPDGTRDLVFQDAQRKEQLIEDLRTNYLFRGYREIITPTVEFYDLFTARTNTIPTEMMYKMTDSKGRLIVLRPDCTAPIARVVSTRLRDSVMPLKLHYTQNVMRSENALRGRLNETTQSGVELIGAAGIKADLEVICTAISSLMLTGLPFKVELGAVSFFNALAAKIPFEPEEMDGIQEAIRYKNISALSDLLAPYFDIPEGKALTELPNLFGDKAILKKAKALTDDEEALAALSYLEDLYEELEALGFSKYISLDLGLVLQLDYYTGLVFKGYVSGAGTEVLSGGRYDRLYEALGNKKPAIGFAINVDGLADVIALNGEEEEELSSEVLVCYEKGCAKKAYQTYHKLTADGFLAEIDVTESKEEAIAYAKERGITKIITVTASGITEEEREEA